MRKTRRRTRAKKFLSPRLVNAGAREGQGGAAGLKLAIALEGPHSRRRSRRRLASILELFLTTRLGILIYLSENSLRILRMKA